MPANSIQQRLQTQKKGNPSVLIECIQRFEAGTYWIRSRSTKRCTSVFDTICRHGKFLTLHVIPVYKPLTKIYIANIRNDGCGERRHTHTHKNKCHVHEVWTKGRMVVNDTGHIILHDKEGFRVFCNNGDEEKYLSRARLSLDSYSGVWGADKEPNGSNW